MLYWTWVFSICNHGGHTSLDLAKVLRRQPGMDTVVKQLHSVLSVHHDLTAGVIVKWCELHMPPRNYSGTHLCIA